MKKRNSHNTRHRERLHQAMLVHVRYNLFCCFPNRVMVTLPAALLRSREGWNHEWVAGGQGASGGTWRRWQWPLFPGQASCLKQPSWGTREALSLRKTGFCFWLLYGTGYLNYWNELVLWIKVRAWLLSWYFCYLSPTGRRDPGFSRRRGLLLFLFF